MTTAPTGLRDRKKAATREAFLAETRDLLEAMPPSRFTVQDICDGANMGTRSFHRYFDTKADALLEVCGVHPFRPDLTDRDEAFDADGNPLPHLDYVLVARCYEDLGAPWLGAMISRISDGSLEQVEAASHAARRIIERGLAQMALRAVLT